MRGALFVLLFSFSACASPAKPKTSDEAPPPITVIEKPDGKTPMTGKKSGWTYTGNRSECRFVANRKCFTDETAACKHAACATSCVKAGVGPTRITCAPAAP